MSEEEAVQVAVRMRIFNKRETDASASRIIRMTREDKGSKTLITNPETNEEKEFRFDYSFNSHARDPEVGPYATQDTVFNDLGRPVMEMALEGRNICLFAYGQTGAGKSFSMLGKTDIEELQGIIPRTCREIFRVIDETKGNDLIKASVSIQVVEVYCEQINDLLADRKTWPPGGHKPRLTKDGYTCDTVVKPCMNYGDIEKAFKFADHNRSVGSHALNPESSRAHTIYTIKYERKTRTSETATQEEVVTSRINLVDLAGSERTESAGTSGQMLKEGNAINLSLTALGNCIHALSEGKRPGYRDSKLTLLLQGSMTNGKVIMIAAVSPASICFEESMSTLRFAERIKMVKIKAKKNVTLDPVAEIKKEMEEMRNRMQQEIDELKTRGGGGGGGGGTVITGADPEELKALKALLEEQKENEKALREDMERQVRELAETEVEKKANADKISAQWRTALGAATDEKKEDIKEPHLLNLNPEPRLAETLIYKLKNGKTSVGRAHKESPPDLDFSGMGMLKDHCYFTWKGNKVTIHVSAPGARVLINGQPVESEAEVKHNYRVWLGNNYAFRFAFPGHQAEGDKQFNEEVKADYFFAEEEIAKEAAKASGATGQPSALSHKLSEALKKVEQANIISGDLNRDCVFQPKILTNRITGENQVVVYVTLPQGTLLWPWEKFNVRLVDMVKTWESWQYATNNEVQFNMPADEQNPFVDHDYQLVGEADVWLQSLGNMIDISLDPPVLNVSGTKEGDLSVLIAPLDENNDEGPWDDDEKADLDPFVEKAEDLKGKDIRFIVKVAKLRFDVDLGQGGRPKYRDTWVRYKINAGDHTEEFTESAHDTTGRIDPEYKHQQKFKRFVDEDFYRHITKGKVTFQVWGKLIEDAPASARVQRLPDGWKKVWAYQDPEGKLHAEAPKMDNK
jgi:kinesin family protein 1